MHVVSDTFIHFNGFVFKSYDGKDNKHKAYVPILVYLYASVSVKHLRWRWNDESTFEGCFSNGHFDILPVTPTVFTNHNTWLKIVLCLKQPVRIRGIYTPVHAYTLYLLLQVQLLLMFSNISNSVVII